MLVNGRFMKENTTEEQGNILGRAMNRELGDLGSSPNFEKIINWLCTCKGLGVQFPHLENKSI